MVRVVAARLDWAFSLCVQALLAVAMARLLARLLVIWGKRGLMGLTLLYLRHLCVTVHYQGAEAMLRDRVLSVSCSCGVVMESADCKT